MEFRDHIIVIVAVIFLIIDGALGADQYFMSKRLDVLDARPVQRAMPVVITPTASPSATPTITQVRPVQRIITPTKGI